MKLLMIFTGGTIACRRGDSGLAPDAENSFALLEPFAEHEFECATPYFTLSENLGFDMLLVFMRNTIKKIFRDAEKKAIGGK